MLKGERMKEKPETREKSKKIQNQNGYTITDSVGKKSSYKNCEREENGINGGTKRGFGGKQTLVGVRR